MDKLSIPAQDSSSLAARAVCFEIKPFAIGKKGTQMTFLDVWGDPPIQAIKISGKTPGKTPSNTQGKANDKEYIPAVTKNRKGSGFRAILINWGLIQE